MTEGTQIQKGGEALIKVLLLIALNVVVTYLVVVFFNANSSKVLYVSQNELIELEKARVGNNKLEDRELFFGMSDEAVKLATEIPKRYEDRLTKVVYSVDKVIGNGTKSISKELHKQIIKELAKVNVRKHDKAQKLDSAGNNE